MPHSSAFGLALAALLSLGSPHPSSYFLGTYPSSVTLEILGETQILLPPLTGLAGPTPGVLQALRPQPLLLRSLERTLRGPASRLVCGGSLSSSSHALKGKVPAPPAVLQRGPRRQDFGVQGRPPSTGARSQSPEGPGLSPRTGASVMRADGSRGALYRSIFIWNLLTGQ